jgi:serine/threonine protein kinase
MTSKPTERDPLEALAAEFMERQRRGERPSITEYTQQHPELAEEIQELFPTVAALEGWKLDRAPLAPPALSPPIRTLSYLGDYRIIREIGRGGMGIVYEAEQESLGRHVALKVLPQGPLLHEKQLRRFEREAKTAARLHHTNIVPVFGVGEQDGLHYYVMQFIRGVGLDAVIEAMRTGQATGSPLEGRAAKPGAESIASFTAWQAANALRSGSFPPIAKEPAPDQRSGIATTSFTAARPVTPNPDSQRGEGNSPTEIHAKAPLTQAQLQTDDGPTPVAPARPAPCSKAYWQGVARLGRQVASALDYAHSQNVLHRDIKPANLLLDAAGIVWVADFGLAKVLEQPGVSNTGDIVGTLQYMAPEQFQGNHDARSDICSLGLTLYELLTLQPAFQDSNHSRLIHRITQQEPPRLRKRNGAIPRDLETIVHKAIARDPARRYATAKELHDDLERFLEDRPIRARRVGYGERLARWCRRNPAVAGLTLLATSLLLLVAVVATAGYIRTRDALEGERQALGREKGQRQRAEANFKRAEDNANQAEDNAKQAKASFKQASDALDREKEQRHRAEATANLSLDMLEEIFERLAPLQVVAASQLTVASAGEEQFEVALQPTLSPETAALLEKLLVFYDRLAAQGNDDTKVRRQAAKATRRVGDIRLHLGQTEQALEAYEHAVSKYKDLAKQFPDDTALMTELAGVYNALGQAQHKSNQFTTAKEAHLAAIQVLTAHAFASEPPATIRYELARTYFRLGKLAREVQLPPPDPKNPKKSGDSKKPGDSKKSGDSKKPNGPPPWVAAQVESEQYLGKAVQLLRILVKDEAAVVPAYRHLLALCYREKSTVFALPPKTDPNDRKEAVNLLEQLVKLFPHVPEYRFDLSETLAQLDVRGPVLPPGSAATEKDFQEALRLAKELVTEHPNVPDYQLSKAQIHHRLAMTQRKNGEAEKAEKNMRQAVALQNSLAQRFPKVQFHQFTNIMFHDRLIDVLLDQKKWADSRPLLESNIKQLKKLIGQDKSLLWWNHPLADNYGKLAKTLRELQEPELAAQAEQQAREIRQTFPKGDKKGPSKEK